MKGEGQTNLHLKGQTQKCNFFAHTQKGANLKSYNKLSGEYFELKFHTHSGDTIDLYETRHNMSPLNIKE